MEKGTESDNFADFEMRKLILHISRKVTSKEFKELCYLSKAFGVGDGELENCEHVHELFSLLERKDCLRLASSTNRFSSLEGVFFLLNAINRRDLVRDLEKHWVMMMIYSLITTGMSLSGLEHVSWECFGNNNHIDVGSNVDTTGGTGAVSASLLFCLHRFAGHNILFVCLFVCLFICLFVYLFVCLLSRNVDCSY